MCKSRLSQPGGAGMPQCPSSSAVMHLKYMAAMPRAATDYIPHHSPCGGVMHIGDSQQAQPPDGSNPSAKLLRPPGAQASILPLSLFNLSICHAPTRGRLCGDGCGGAQPPSPPPRNWRLIWTRCQHS